MRILVLTNMYPPHHYGGYELSCHDVMRRFRQRGHSVLVLTSKVRVPGADSTGEDRGTVRRELDLYWDEHRLVSPSPWRRLSIERHNQRRLSAALHEAEPDVVSVWNMGAMSLGLLTSVASRGVPMVLNLGDDWLAYGPRLDAWSRLWLAPRRRAAGRAVTALTGVPTVLPDLGALGACTFNSEATRRFAVEHTPWSFPRTGVVYSGIEPSDFPVPPDGAPVRDRPWRGALLCVGRIDRRKGIDTAIRATARLDGAHLRVLGQGDPALVDELGALAGELGVGDRVEFAAAPRADLRSAYRDADVCIFPSTWAEPFGLVPLEAMSCDTPVAATGTGGSAEYLDDGVNCVLFAPGDPAALADSIDKLRRDAALRAAVVRAGRATARQFSTDALAEVLEQWHLAAAAGFAGDLPSDRVVSRAPR